MGPVGCDLMGEHLPGMCKVLCLIPNEKKEGVREEGLRCCYNLTIEVSVLLQ